MMGLDVLTIIHQQSVVRLISGGRAFSTASTNESSFLKRGGDQFFKVTTRTSSCSRPLVMALIYSPKNAVARRASRSANFGSLSSTSSPVTSFEPTVLPMSTAVIRHG